MLFEQRTPPTLTPTTPTPPPESGLSIQQNQQSSNSHQRSAFGATRSWLPKTTQGVVIMLAVLFLSATSYALVLSGSISGTVTDTDGLPLSGINVTVYESSEYGDWNTIDDVTSDEQGRYTLESLPGGTYRVGFQAEAYPPPYQPEFYDDANDIDLAADLTVGEDQELSAIDAQLTKTGSISGNVTDEAGNPLSNINVTIYYNSGDPCCPGNWGIADNLQTDSNGNYSILGKPDGIYRIEFFDYTYVYQREYYDNAVDLASAMDIPMVDGQDITGIDAKLQKTPTISGQVTDEDGEPLSGIQVKLYREDMDPCCLGGWIRTAHTHTDGDGHYAIPVESDGTYRVGFFDFNQYIYQTEYYENATGVGAATDITMVDAQDVTGIDAQLTRPAMISGKVTDESGVPLSNIFVNLYYKSMESCCVGEWSSTAGTSTDSDGNYSIVADNDGTYRIGFFDDYIFTTYQMEYYDDALDLASASDIVIAGQDVTGIDAQLTRAPTISGRVTNESGSPLPNVTVELYAQYMDPCCLGNWYSTGFSDTDADGNYSIAIQNDGTYRIRFLDDFTYTYQAEYYDNAFDLASATNIVMADRQDMTGIDAQLARNPTISGQVTDESGTPLSGISVELFAQNGDPSGSVQWYSTDWSYTDADGNYSFIRRNDGTYRIRFFDDSTNTYRAEYYDNASSLESATDIVVASQDVVGIDATLAVAATIPGNVDCDDDLDAVDALFTLQYIVGLRRDHGGCPLGDSLTQIYAAGGDFDGNGQIEAIDALFVLQCVVGLSNDHCSVNAATMTRRIAPQAVDSIVGTVDVLMKQSGQTIDIQLDAADLNPAVGAFELHYDSGTAQLIDCGVVAGQGTCQESADGVVRLAFVNAVGLTGVQSIAQLTFDAADISLDGIQTLTLADSAGRGLAAEITTEDVPAEQGGMGQKDKPSTQLYIPFINQ